MLEPLVKWNHNIAVHSTGMDRLEAIIRQHFYHPNLYHVFQKVVSNCTICPQVRTSSPKTNKLSLILTFYAQIIAVSNMNIRLGNNFLVIYQTVITILISFVAVPFQFSKFTPITLLPFSVVLFMKESIFVASHHLSQHLDTPQCGKMS